MTDPVDTEALAEDAITGAGLSGMDSVAWLAASAGVKRGYRAAADEVDRLRAVIEKAPHGSGCHHVDWVDGLLQLGECDCWKADVL